MISIFNNRKYSLTIVVCSTLIFLSLYVPILNGLPSDSILEDFSLCNALTHVKYISEKPHPVGSLYHDNVKTYILSELSKLNCTSHVQKKMAVSNITATTRVGIVENIIAVLPGYEGKKNILITIHYDSIPFTHGAGDNGIGLASSLEVIRILKSGEKLKNNIIFLFTDGEECGFLGAEAFYHEHPLAKQIDFVMNFDSMGNSGNSIIVETSGVFDKDMFLFYKKLFPFVSQSAIPSAYNKINALSDFSVFKRNNIPGIFFSTIGGYSFYHTIYDNYKNIDSNALIQQGCNMLTGIRYFGNTLQPEKGSEENNYFGIFGYPIVISKGYISILLFITLVLFLGSIFLYIKYGNFNIRDFIFGIFTFIPIVFTGALFSFLIIKILSLFEYFNVNPDCAVKCYIACFLMSLSIVCLYFIFFLKKRDLFSAYSGFSLWILILIFVLFLYLPGSVYVLLIPFLLSFISICVIKNFYNNKMIKILFSFLSSIFSSIVIFFPIFNIIANSIELEILFFISPIITIISLLLIFGFSQFSKPFLKYFSLIAFLCGFIILMLPSVYDIPGLSDDITELSIYNAETEMSYKLKAIKPLPKLFYYKGMDLKNYNALLDKNNNVFEVVGIQNTDNFEFPQVSVIEDIYINHKRNLHLIISSKKSLPSIMNINIQSCVNITQCFLGESRINTLNQSIDFSYYGNSSEILELYIVFDGNDAFTLDLINSCFLIGISDSNSYKNITVSKQKLAFSKTEN